MTINDYSIFPGHPILTACSVPSQDSNGAEPIGSFDGLFSDVASLRLLFDCANQLSSLLLELIRDAGLSAGRVASQTLAGMMLLLCCGCVVGPDYKGVTTPPLLPSFFGDPTEPEADDAHQPTPPPSWHRFDDEVLNQLIRKGLDDSNSLAELLWRLQESRSIVGIVAGQKQPFVDGTLGYENRKRSINAQPFVGANGDPFNVFSVGVQSRWEIDLFGRIARETEAAQADFHATQEEYNDLRRVLVGEIARAYIQVRQAQEQLAQNQANLLVQQLSVEQVESRIAAGRVGKLDLAQLGSRIGLTQADTPLFREQLQLSLNRLALLIGQSPNQELFDWIAEAPQLTPPSLSTGVPADLIRHRPDVRQAEREVAAASARIGVAKADLYPRLTLVGNISFDAQTLGQLIDTDSLAYNIGPGFSWNILSLGRIQKAVQVRKAQLQQAVSRYRQTVLTAVHEVENSLASGKETVKRIKVLEETVQDASESVHLATQQYLADRASLERVVSNQRRLLRASQQLTEARAERATAMVDLIQATGITWLPDESEAIGDPASCWVAESDWQLDGNANRVSQIALAKLQTNLVEINEELDRAKYARENSTEPDWLGQVSPAPKRLPATSDTGQRSQSPSIASLERWSNKN